MTPRQNSGSVRCSSQSPRCFRYRAANSGAIQVLVCTPFVILVIGTSCIGTPDHTSFHSDRLTSPCNLLTPFACLLSRNARIVILKGSSGLRRVWPNENSSSNGRFNSFANFPKYFCIISREKESLPAGTGVCVVKTLAAATTCSAE